jgi:hypothetical protein
MHKQLWIMMLRTDMNVRYWDELIRRHLKKERRLQLALALASSGTAATLFVPLGPMWGRVVSVLTASLSIYLGWLTSTKPVDRMSAIKRAHNDALIAYEQLWARLEANPQDPGADDKFRQLQASQVSGTAEEPHFVKDDDLLRACQADVKRSRGI